MVELFALRMTEPFSEEIFRTLLTFVDTSKQERVKRFRHWEDAHRTLLADLLVRSILLEKTGQCNEVLTFICNEFGKPSLKGSSTFHFNVSHSGEWIAAGVDDHPVGVDVEEIRPIDFDVAKRFFSPEEYQTLMGQSESEQLAYFYSIWTLKESFIKALGRGLSHPLAEFTIRAEKAKEIHLVLDQQIVPELYFKSYDLDPHYRMAVCSQSTHFAESIAMKTMNEIYHTFQESH